VSERPVASVVIPSYNHARFVGEAVESALAQSLRDIEVVIVDDGSSDGSVEILRELADSPRVVLVEQENRGAHAAIARGLERARGDHLFVLNSDDAFAPNRVEALVERFLARPEVAAACSWIEVVDGRGVTLGVKEAWRTLPPWLRPEPGPNLDELGDPALSLLATNFVATTSNLAFRRDLLPKVTLAPLRYCHDWDLALQLAQLGELAVVGEPLVRYRVHDANTLSEGRDASDGTAAMRFEILWVVARHATAVLTERAARCAEDEQLCSRFWRSVPRFGRLDVASWLISLAQALPEPAYEAMLAADHPIRRRLTAALRDP